MKGISAALTDKSIELPEASSKAFSHWPKISRDLHDLFIRAPTEAITDDTAVLARLTLDAVMDSNYPAGLAQKVRVEAHSILENSAEAKRERIAAAIAEPLRLLVHIDGFILSLQQGRNALPHSEATAEACKFLEWCRQLDSALSATPVRLRVGITSEH